MKKILLLMFAILLVQASIVEAQTFSFVQSRYYGAPNSQSLSSATPTDGIVHIRFKPGATRVFRDGSDDKFEFTVQLRHAGDQERYLNLGGFRMTYDEDVFGANLNIPPIIQNFALNPAAQCVPTRGELVADEDKYDLEFADSFSDELNILAISADATELRINRAPKDNFSLLTPGWQDLLTMTCTIPTGNTNAESDVAISGTEPIASNIREFPSVGSVSATRAAVLLPDNDIRGFRLDGKTYAEDYARYGGGTGVRVQFSKAISTALTMDNFVFEDDVEGAGTTTPTVSNVIHNAGSFYANIEFDQIVNSGVLRLVSTLTNVVNDADGAALADGSFVAALFYDADAPSSPSITKTMASTSDNSQSQWQIAFTKPINTATIRKENICVTESNGICLAVEQTSPTVPVLDVAFSPTDATTTTAFTITIDEGPGKVGGMRSVEFKRNAVLGVDLKIVEDYQTSLRNILTLNDNIGANITIVSVDENGNPTGNENITPDGGNYTLYFRVEADENVADLETVGSYQLVSLVNNSQSNLSGSATIVSGSVAPGRRVIFKYVVSDSSVGMSTTGFNLRKVADPDPSNPTILVDNGGNSPVSINTEAYARRDATPPRLSITATPSEPLDDDPTTYEMTFTITANEAVPTISSTASYNLLRVLRDDSTVGADVSGEPMVTVVMDTPNEVVVRITYRASLTPDQLANTKGFTLAVSSGALEDESLNSPVRDSDGSAIAADTAIDDSDDAVATTDITSPVIEVTAQGGMANPNPNNGNRYSMVFEITADEDVPQLSDSDSYRLLRIVGDEDIDVTSLSITDPITTGTQRFATISYDVELPAGDTLNTDGFTLGLNGDKLRDVAGNPPTNRGANRTTTPTIIADGDRIDPHPDAVAERDTRAPQIRVRAYGMAAADAPPSNVYTGTGVYRGSFTVDTETEGETIRGIRDPSSYKLLRQSIYNENWWFKVSAMINTSGTNTITFVTDPMPEGIERDTKGFTLAYKANLSDLANNEPIMTNGRLDTNVLSIALRDIDPPVITVVAVDGTLEATPSGVYSGNFTVRADEPILGIDVGGSYKLLRRSDSASAAVGTTVWLEVPAGFDPAGTDPTERTIEFETTAPLLREVELDTSGFVLGYKANLGDYANNSPVILPNGLINARQAIFDRATTPLEIVVEVLNDKKAVAANITTSSVSYTMQFRVKGGVDGDRALRGISSTSSYVLIRQPEVGSLETIDATPVIETNADETMATLTYTLILPRDDAERTAGFTIGRVGNSLEDLVNNKPQSIAGMPLDPSAIALTKTMECAAFYPDIGQKELFVRVKGYGLGDNEPNDPPDGVVTNVPDDGDGFDLAILRSGFSLDPNLALAGATQQSKGEYGDVTIVKLALSDEIKGASSIDIKYDPYSGPPENRKVRERTISCGQSIELDTDGDRVVDAVDNNPFVSPTTTNLVIVLSTELNRAIASTSTSMVEAPTTTTAKFYSHDKLVRSVLRKEQYSYYDNDDNDDPLKTIEGGAITAAQYFGVVDGSRTFRAFRNFECTILESAKMTRDGYYLTQINIAENCADSDVTDSFGNEAVGTRDYMWAEVNDAGRLIPSDYLTLGITVLPEINFSGQSSYLLTDGDPAKTVTVSAYTGSDDAEASRAVIIGRTTTDTTARTTLLRVGDNLLKGSYDEIIASIGEHWLVGGSGIWRLTEDNIGLPDEGGRDLASIKYAIGPNNNIRVKVAEEGQEVTKIHQILIYDATDENNLQRVTSMVATDTRTYYVVVDYTTNIEDITIEQTLPEGYTPTISTSTISRATTLVEAQGDLVGDNVHVQVIDLEVNEDEDVRTITVGWDTIGNVKKVQATYIASAEQLANYVLNDSDGDGVPNAIDAAVTTATQLQAFNPEEAKTGSSGNILQVIDSGQMLSVSDVTRIIAIGRATARGTATNKGDWAAANIGYIYRDGGMFADSGLDQAAEDNDVIAPFVRDLEFIDDEVSIQAITTFEVSGIDYADIDDNGNAVGGITHVVFPMAYAGPMVEALYLGKHDDENDRWESFERDTGGYDTWYAIERQDDTTACPTDPELYKNEHRAIGEDGLGFESYAHTCIMVVITDGGPYDSDGAVDGRVIDPLAMATASFAEPQPVTPPRRRGGGGGSIGVGDILLLISALLLLLSFVRRQPKHIADKSS